MNYNFRHTKKWLSFLVIIFFTISCSKNVDNLQMESLTSDQLCKKIADDPFFSKYVAGIQSLMEKRVFQSEMLSENQFQEYYKNAIVNSDLDSKKIIANAMGYEFYEVFWNERDNMNYAIKTLSCKYDLQKLDRAQWKELIKNKIIELENFRKINNVAMSFEGGPKCAEKYWNCMEQAAATYAVEQVACFSFAGLGWTGIGVAAFIGCETASRWHLNTMKKGCEIDFRICNEK